MGKNKCGFFSEHSVYGICTIDMCSFAVPGLDDGIECTFEMTTCGYTLGQQWAYNFFKGKFYAVHLATDTVLLYPKSI